MIKKRTEIPVIKKSKYSDYKEWLCNNSYDGSCSYCWMSFGDSIQIDHFIPQKFKPELINDPDNLLISCQACNSCKGDYHPDYLQSKKGDKLLEKYSLHNIYKEDVNQIFKFNDSTGELMSKNASDKRSAFCINFFRLNRTRKLEERKKLFELLNFIEKKDELLKNLNNTADKGIIDYIILTYEAFIKDVKKLSVFLEIFEYNTIKKV